MDQPTTWAEALDITPDRLTAWSAEAPEGQPVLVYCLEKGHVDVTRYLEWATEATGHARLDARFFSEACDIELVRGARDLESYSAWFFPVMRWDDVTYIACVEAPTDEDAPPGYCFVLADPRVMRETWELAGEGGTALTSLTNVRIGAEHDTEVADVPQGFNAGETKLFTLNLDGVSLNLDGHLAPPPPRDTATASSPARDAVTTEAPLAPMVPPPEAPPKKPAVALVIPKVLEDTSATALTATVPSVPAVTTRSMPFQAPPAPTTSLAIPSNENAALTRVFSILTDSFPQVCVLRRSDAMIRLHRWSPTMTPSAQGASLDLNYPSFLRVVSRTNMPYHGYLVDSPTHREFFKALGLTDLPACATAVPLMVDDALWGVLLALGPAERQDLESLRKIEDVGRQLAEALAPTWRRAA